MPLCRVGLERVRYGWCSGFVPVSPSARALVDQDPRTSYNNLELMRILCTTYTGLAVAHPHISLRALNSLTLGHLHCAQGCRDLLHTLSFSPCPLNLPLRPLHPASTTCCHEDEYLSLSPSRGVSIVPGFVWLDGLMERPVESELDFVLSTQSIRRRCWKR